MFSKLTVSKNHGLRFLSTSTSTSTKGFIKEGWEAVIGIEVHAQINTKTKLFSGKKKKRKEKKPLPIIFKH